MVGFLTHNFREIIFTRIFVKLISRKIDYLEFFFHFYCSDFAICTSFFHFTILDKRKEKSAENIYILTLDGDIDFQPSAVKLLVDLMKKDKGIGAACGRIHPVSFFSILFFSKFLIIYLFIPNRWAQDSCIVTKNLNIGLGMSFKKLLSMFLAL